MVGEIVDKIITNPANDLFGGYYPFLRRVVLPLVFILIFGILFELSGGRIAVAAIITGFSLGPILLLERWILIQLINRRTLENQS